MGWQAESINSRDVLKDPPSVSGAFQHKKVCFSENRFSSWVMAGSQGPSWSSLWTVAVQEKDLLKATGPKARGHGESQGRPENPR